MPMKARKQLQALYDQGFRALAIVLMHAWRYPEHELQLADIARQIGFTQISVSHQVSPLLKIVSRGDTTVVDAYLSPLLKRYVAQVAEGLGGDARLVVHAIQRRPGRRTGVSRQGQHSLGTGGRHRRRGERWRNAPVCTKSSLSIWAARPPMSPIMPGNWSAVSKPKSPASECAPR